MIETYQANFLKQFRSTIINQALTWQTLIFQGSLKMSLNLQHTLDDVWLILEEPCLYIYLEAYCMQTQNSVRYVLTGDSISLDEKVWENWHQHAFPLYLLWQHLMWWYAYFLLYTSCEWCSRLGDIITQNDNVPSCSLTQGDISQGRVSNQFCHVVRGLNPTLDIIF